jgi:hypothetical protein
MRRHSTALVIFIVLFLTTAPYLYAASIDHRGAVFAGMLQNPIDGASYLAKMRQGWNGSWLFHLPYTAGPSTGHPIFLFYLFLGHLARVTGTSLVVIYHAARATGSVLMILAMARFFHEVLPDTQSARFSLILASFGAGLGWLFYPLIGMTSDFWVTEAYPFLAAYTNPHFPIGLAILIWLLSGQNVPSARPAEGARLIVGAALLSVILPFAVVVLLIVQWLTTLWDAIRTRRFYLLRPILLAAGGMPYLIYQYLVISSDPSLRAWNLQNLTPAPLSWDLIISLSPALVLAIIGSIFIERKRYITGRILIVWVITAMILLVIPFNLQRRFMLGLYIPLAGLTAFGWIASARIRFMKRYGRLLVMIFSVPTILMVLAAGISGIVGRDSQLYLSADEYGVMKWMQTNVPTQAVVLGAPDTGLFIPSRAGQQVIYGHPFETINATRNKELVEKTLRGDIPTSELENIVGVPIDYLFWGPRELEFSPSPPAGLNIAYQSGDVTLFALH